MNEIVKGYIGKDCIIYTFQSQVTGIIETVENNWISVKTKSGEEIINMDFISRIRAYPLKKNGKKKEIILD